MIEGVIIDDEGYRKYTPNKGPERASFLTVKAKIYVSATFLASILILVSLQGWIVDDVIKEIKKELGIYESCLLYTSPSPRDLLKSRMPSSA